jgi:serine/threonine protein kinase
MKFQLAVEAGVHQGLAFSTRRAGVYRIGRAGDADLALTKDTYTSREHCVVELTPRGARIRDVGSRSGTHVNGKLIREGPLADGDTVLIGRTVLMVALAGVAPTTAPIERPVGVPGFTLVKRLPMDGPGQVWWASSDMTDRLVILHVVSLDRPADDRETKRFMRQAGICARLHHPGLARFLTQGITGNRFWFATEIIEGESLRKFVEKHGPLSEEDAVHVICQALDIVVYLHQEDVVHRNLRPESMLVKRQSGAFTVHIADLGSAKCFLSAELQQITTLSERSASIHGFTAPEVLIDFEELAPRSDIYALGAILHFILTGQDPYHVSADKDLATMILETDPRPIHTINPNLSQAIVNVVERAMARDVNRRYGTVREMWDALQGVVIDMHVMDVSEEEIDQQLQLLETHRRRLKVLLQQEARLGSAFTPPGVITDIGEACAEINRIKVVLRGWGIQVADMPDDERRV